MRFDDTNPTKEKEEFVESIKKLISHGLVPTGRTDYFFASDYFPQMYEECRQAHQERERLMCATSLQMRYGHTEEH